MVRNECLRVAFASSDCVDSSSDIRAVSGTCSRFVKDHVPGSAWNTFPVAGNQTPRQVLAANLKELLKLHKLSAPTVAKRAGIDPKSMNNMLHARFESRRENVDAVAKVFGLTGWQLIRRNMDFTKNAKEIPKASEIELLIDMYTEATPEHRETIMHVAEMAGPPYRTKK